MPSIDAVRRREISLANFIEPVDHYVCIANSGDVIEEVVDDAGVQNVGNSRGGSGNVTQVLPCFPHCCGGSFVRADRRRHAGGQRRLRRLAKASSPMTMVWPALSPPW